MMGNIVVRTGPGAEPISLQEAKLHCRVESDFTADDTLIRSLIVAARRHVENKTGRVVVTQGLRSTLHCFPGRFGFDHLGYLPSDDSRNRRPRIDLRAPLRKVTSISYLDTAGVSQTLAITEYVVDLSELPGIVVPSSGKCWPSTYDHPQAVIVNFISGYATSFTADAATDVITAIGHPYATGDIVPVSNTGGALPAGLSVGVNYYAVSVTADTLQLSTTEGGAAVDITDAGTGTSFLGVIEEDIKLAMLLMIMHWYEHRDEVSDFQLFPVPNAAEMLLAPHKVYGF